MQKVRAQYEDIFKEIEGDDTDLLVVWPNDFSLCYPKFVSKKQAANSKPVNSKASSKLVDDRTFTCSNNENEGSSVMKFVPDHKKNEIKTIRFHDENYVNAGINKEQLNYLELDNLKKMPKNELINIRESVSLELLWIQQAIQSRVQVYSFLILVLVLAFTEFLFMV